MTARSEASDEVRAVGAGPSAAVPPAGKGGHRRAAVAAALTSQWTRYLLQIVGLVVLARLLTPKDYGVVASVTAITGIAAVIGDFGLSLAALQAVGLTAQQRTNLWWANTGIGALTGAVVAALAYPIAGFYGRPELFAVCLALAAVFPVSGAAVQYSVELVRSQRMVVLAVAEVLAAALGLVVAIIAAGTGAGYWAVVIQQVVTAVLALGLLVILTRWRPSTPRRGAGMRPFLSFGRDTAGLQVLNYVSSNLDSVLIARFFGQAVLGLYNRAYQIVGVPVQQLVGPLTRLVLPALAAKVGDEDFDRTLLSLHRMIVLVLLSALSFCGAVAEPLIALVLGDRWLQASPLLQVLAVGGAFQAIGFIYYWAFLARGATRALFFSELWGRVLSIVLMLVVAPFGTLFIAGAAAVGQIVVWGCSAFVYARRIGLDWKPLVGAATPMLLAFAASGATGGTVAGLLRGDLLLQIAGSCAAWLVVLAVLVVVSRRVRRSVLLGVAAARRFAGSRNPEPAA